MTLRLPLMLRILVLTLSAAKLDWAEIDPSILGTLFERGLDPDKRSQLGAHYTDRRKPEVVSGFADRVLPISESAAAALKKRTLTNLYNERPTWLANAHADLDAAVADAYGWPADNSEDDALAKLFELNQARAAGQLLAEAVD